MAETRVTEEFEYQRGEIDGRKDGGDGVKPLALTIQERHYSASYRAGYKVGYEKASEPRRLRQEGQI